MIVKEKSKLILVVTAFAVFLATFNETFLNVAFQSISVNLNVGFNTVQWLATAYMLGAAVMIPVSAFLYRKIPTKLLFVITLIFFIVGSIIGGLAQNFVVLLIGRVLQAIGSGMLIPIAMNVVLDIAPREKLGKYMGIMGAMTTLGPSLSIVIAGLLLNAGDWHILFWVFGALSVVCLILGACLLNNVAKLTKPKLDILSVILIGIALVGILYTISTIFTAWLTATITLVIGVICLIFFVKRQKKISEPLINLAPLKVKPFAYGVIINMLALILVFAFNILIPQFLQNVKGLPPLDTSIILFPAILLSCIIAPIAGAIYDKKGIRVLLPFGFALMGLFIMLIAILIGGTGWVVGVLYVPVIVGSAMIIGPIQSHALSFLKAELNPHGVTIMSTGFQVAGCIGASLFVSVYSISESATSSALSAILIVGLLALLCAIIGLILSLITAKFKRTVNSDNVKTDLISIMKKDVYTIPNTSTILNAMQIMLDKKISGLPIIENDGKLVGFISDGDIMRYLSKNNTSIKNVYSFVATKGEDNDFTPRLQKLINLNVMEIVTHKIFTVNENEEITDVCRVLSDEHLKKVPVMKGDQMVGIVNRSDITKFAMKLCVENNK